jgi:hypothetical protein
LELLHFQALWMIVMLPAQSQLAELKRFRCGMEMLI